MRIKLIAATLLIVGMLGYSVALPSFAAQNSANQLSFVSASGTQAELQPHNLCLRSASATQTLSAEFAITAETRAEGLMMRETLAENAAMLFVYDYTASRSFWMYRTLIPLDIAYINARGEILDIQQMQPCRSYWSNRCPSYPAAAPFLYALEVNLGKFAEWGVSVGDTLLASDCETSIEDAQPWR
ncbi:hypothetical protein CWE08_04605 [Aliidiomarina iranensis]|uniref:DUF192 domain-containing protein n=1 Tax=Aliidiomarina iranensis TaxID=1434071 RepID=A0A432W0E4_9GAMM|nr:DUF192 domain-containing protein [Aliidiomarina iranensis]RUO22462.1 hypothetical protein CWE08_04605 [Aliidiomarina iranensis]